MQLTINGVRGSWDAPVSVSEAIAQLAPQLAAQAIGAVSGGTVYELNHLLHKDVDLQVLTYADEEGRRIYERSLRFVLLLAARRLYPQARVLIEHSIGQGVYIRLENMRLTAWEVNEIEGLMHDIVAEDIPFVAKRWSRQEAIAYFRSIGETDKARLLEYRPYDYFNVYEAGGMAEYFYGAMLPSTRCLQVFALYARAPGLVMLLPDKKNPQHPAAYISAPKHMAVFAQSNDWCRLLSCSTAADLNDLIVRHKLRDFIRVNEALHDKTLAGIAEDIISRNARAIFIAGPSSSGKTTFANRLAIHLRASGLQPVMISLDDFYLNRDHLPLEADGQPDLEALGAIDVPFFQQALGKLMAGEETMLPHFDFTAQKRVDELYPLRVSARQPLIIEGIHGLNPALHEPFDPLMLCRIYISQLTCLNLDNHNRIRTTDARLLRRIVRDHQFRNTPAQTTLAMWDSVRRGEEKWIFPYQENADIVFNSALHYELPILKTIAYDMLRSIPHDHPQFIRCNRLLKILNYFLPVAQELFDEIPPLSILREFIGGNTLYRKEAQ